jgi:hypothetical protein
MASIKSAPQRQSPKKPKSYELCVDRQQLFMRWDTNDQARGASMCVGQRPRVFVVCLPRSFVVVVRCL